jgi:mannitol 2-dehydrogenase
MVESTPLPRPVTPPNPDPHGTRPRLTAHLLARLAKPAPGVGGARVVGEPVRTPHYDRSKLAGGITHLGVGGFHRAHLAVYVDDLLSAGDGAWSITGSGVMAHDEKIAGVLAEQDGLYLLAEREGETVSGRIIGSIRSFLPAHDDPQPLLKNLSDPATKIVSLTITEGGYPVEHGAFVDNPALVADSTLQVPRSTFGILCAALESRRRAGIAPFTVLSCDNLPGNGDVARVAVLGAAELRSPELAKWLEANGAFPNAMVDRITPATTDADRAWAAETFGFVDAWPVVCEPFRQWALEDDFVDGRPAFENVGVLMTDDVGPYEKMKLRLLNGSHSGLAYHAALAGIRYVHDAVLDPRVERFMRRLMADEAAPNLVAPVGIDLVAYQESLVRRFSNPAIADTIARLCLDGTAKFPTFIVPSLEDQLRTGGPIRMLALVLAGWCRYLRGTADDGSALALSNDPFLQEAVDVAKRSIADPRAFLHYERALGPNLGHSERLLETFAAALDSLDHHGSLATLDTWATSAS